MDSYDSKETISHLGSTRTIGVVVSRDEYREFMVKAGMKGMSVSNYARLRLGLAPRTRS